MGRNMENIEKIKSNFIYRFLNPSALSTIEILDNFEITISSKKKTVSLNIKDIKNIKTNTHLFFSDIILIDKFGNKIILPFIWKRKTKNVDNWYNGLSLHQKYTELESIINEYFNNKYISYRDNNLFISKEIEKYKYYIRVKNEFSKIFPKIKFELKYKTLSSYLKSPEEFRINHNKNFCLKETTRKNTYLSGLNEKQTLAVITNEDNVLVLAGAGSGKTKVIECKVNYLINTLKVNPSEILVLAFNNKAVNELQERIPILNEDNITTFHKFGSRILKRNPEEQLLDVATNESRYFSFIKGLIIETIEDSNYYNLLYTYFKSFFYKTKNSYEFTNIEEYKNYIYENKLLTLKSEHVKSFGEIDIANYLFLHNIPYEYEAEYKYPYTKTPLHNIYRPDFYIPANNEHEDIYIEFFGIDRDNNTSLQIKKEKYIETIKWKREVHKCNKTNLIELFSYDRFEGNLLKKLKRKLRALKVDTSKLLDKEERLKFLNSQNEFDDFTRLLGTFLQHFKENKYSCSILLATLTNQLKSLSLKLLEIQKNIEKLDIKTKNPDNHMQINNLQYEINQIRRKRVFLKIFNSVFIKYQNKLKTEKKYDFADMISHASDEIVEKHIIGNFKYILVDEFQDISKGRANLLKILLSMNYDSKLFVVGDDWQSINRFAGSDLSIIRNFSKEFGENKTRKSTYIKLNRTYRFNSNISEIASKFIQKNPFQIKKEITARTTSVPSVLVWYTDNEVNALFDIVNKIYENVKNNDNKKTSILILGRYNIKTDTQFGMELQNCIKDMQHNPKYEKIFDITYSTIHSAKGLGKDYVIILNLRQGAFPSSKEDDPILSMVMAQEESFENAEERRLFYVALTRAKEKVYLIGPDNPSAFLIELTDSENHYPVYICNHPDNYSLKMCPQCKTGMMVRPFAENDKFYYCHNPNCKHKAPVCPICGKGFLYMDEKRNSIICSNEDCLYIAESCNICDGILLHRKNSKDSSYFIGCSNFSGKDNPTSCTYTHKVKKCSNCNKKNVFLYKRYTSDFEKIQICCIDKNCPKLHQQNIEF